MTTMTCLVLKILMGAVVVTEKVEAWVLQPTSFQAWEPWAPHHHPQERKEDLYSVNPMNRRRLCLQSSSSSRSYAPENEKDLSSSYSSISSLEEWDLPPCTLTTPNPVRDTLQALAENRLVPLAVPLLAYFSYDIVAETFNLVLEAWSASNRNWVAVDGGSYQAKIIAPAINGLVVPAVAVLFATLTSTTISTLRQRQMALLTALEMEASELQHLHGCFEAILLPDRPRMLPYQDQQNTGQTINGGGDEPQVQAFKQETRRLLYQYSTRILTECDPQFDDGQEAAAHLDTFPFAVIQQLVGFKTSSGISELTVSRLQVNRELQPLVQLLHSHYALLPASSQHLLDQAYTSTARLREQRQIRWAALQSTYPLLHYVILWALSVAECVGFLMQANQDVLVFLNAVQLKLLWSILVGTFVACFYVFYDLAFPFTGSYQISSAALEQIRALQQTTRSQFLAHSDNVKSSFR